jgi:crotonobetainyl-CoA:carnitine CoA-transferase CaiB-like acyl-CoA transferase
MSEKAEPPPLAGLRIVDLTHMLAGPYCTMLLADLGAEIIKVEPIQGDSTRAEGPFMPDDEVRAFGGYFQSVNRGKQSIVIDLKVDAGREALHALLRGADAVVENFRPGVMERQGLSYEALHELYPSLVYVAIRGFGDPRTGASPYSDWPAFDVIAQAFGGAVGITGADVDHPMKIGPGVGDIFPAALAALGAVTAIYQARETGKGRFVDVSMLDAVLSLCERIVYGQSYTDRPSVPTGNHHPIWCPFGLFAATDGWVAIAAPREHQWRKLCTLIGRADMAESEEYSSNQSRQRNRDSVLTALTGWTSGHTKQEILSILGGEVPVGPVHTSGTILDDPHVAARRMVLEVEQPGSLMRGKVAGSPIKFADTEPAAQGRRAPLLGEHTNAVLEAAGVTPEQVAVWREHGGIQ